MPRKPDPHRIKTHRIYTSREAAERLDVHVQTILRWIKGGLITADRSQKPWLIEGRVLKEYLLQLRQKDRCRLRSEQLYCLPCRAPQIPDGRIVDFQLKTPTTGMLIGLCPDCGRAMHKRMHRLDLDAVRAQLDVTIQKAQPRIVGETSASDSVNFTGGARDHGKAQLG